MSEALTPHRLGRIAWHGFLCPVPLQRNKTAGLLRCRRIMPRRTATHIMAVIQAYYILCTHPGRLVDSQARYILTAAVGLAEKKAVDKLGLPFLSSFGATLSLQVHLSGWLWDGVEKRPRLACTRRRLALWESTLIVRLKNGC